MEHAEAYFVEFVEPAMARFEANPRSRLDAFLACVAIFHTVDYLGHNPERPQSRRAARKRRQDFGLRSPAFAKIDKLAHAFKHVISDGNSAAAKGPALSAFSIVERPPAFYGHGYYDFSRYNDPFGGIMFLDDPKTDVLLVARAAVDFIRNELGLTG